MASPLQLLLCWDAVCVLVCFDVRLYSTRHWAVRARCVLLCPSLWCLPFASRSVGGVIDHCVVEMRENAHSSKYLYAPVGLIYQRGTCTQGCCIAQHELQNAFSRPKNARTLISGLLFGIKVCQNVYQLAPKAQNGPQVTQGVHYALIMPKLCQLGAKCALQESKGASNGLQVDPNWGKCRVSNNFALNGESLDQHF